MIRSKSERQKQELLKLKRIMENKFPKIDITNVYVFKENDISYIVAAVIKKGFKNYYELEFIDIFSKKTIFRKCSRDLNRLIKRKEEIYDDKQYRKSHFAFICPVHEKDRSLLAYADGQVPLYILQRLYYKLNKVDLQNPILSAPKEG